MIELAANSQQAYAELINLLGAVMATRDNV